MGRDQTNQEVAEYFLSHCGDCHRILRSFCFILFVMRVELNHQERMMILDALCHDAYKDKVSKPKTKHFIRQIYKSLVEKLANIEAINRQEGKPEKAITALKSHISFLNFKMPGMEKEEKKRQRKRS